MTMIGVIFVIRMDSNNNNNQQWQTTTKIGIHLIRHLVNNHHSNNNNLHSQCNNKQHQRRIITPWVGTIRCGMMSLNRLYRDKQAHKIKPNLEHLRMAINSNKIMEIFNKITTDLVIFKMAMLKTTVSNSHNQ